MWNKMDGLVVRQYLKFREQRVESWEQFWEPSGTSTATKKETMTKSINLSFTTWSLCPYQSRYWVKGDLREFNNWSSPLCADQFLSVSLGFAAYLPNVIRSLQIRLSLSLITQLIYPKRTDRYEPSHNVQVFLYSNHFSYSPSRTHTFLFKNTSWCPNCHLDIDFI